MESTGLIVVAAVLGLGTVAGVWRRRTDGRLQTVTGPVLAVPVMASTAETPSSRTGPAGTAAPGPGDPAGTASDPSAAGQMLDPALLRELGVQAAPATLLQFSSAFCAPCRAVRRVSAEVVTLLPQVQHVEVDAESHLEAVRALGIWRTPTLLVLDADGRVSKRATGVPGKPQLIAALGAVLPAVPGHQPG